MTAVIHLGPLALATDRLLAVAAVWLFVAIGSSKRFGEAQAAIWAASGGILFARVSYVARHFADFKSEPLQVLAIWEGGFDPWAGIVAAALLIAWRARKTTRISLLVLLAILAVGWTAIGQVAVASRTPAFSFADTHLKHLNGQNFDPAVLEGKPVVINLWADWCPPCRREMPYFAGATKEHGDVVFLFVNQGDPPQIASRLPVQHGINQRSVLLDQAGRLSAAYGGALPTTIFIAADGSVRSVHQGAISRAGLRDELALIKEKRP